MILFPFGIYYMHYYNVFTRKLALISSASNYYYYYYYHQLLNILAFHFSSHRMEPRIFNFDFFSLFSFSNDENQKRIDLNQNQRIQKITSNFVILKSLKCENIKNNAFSIMVSYVDKVLSSFPY